MATRRSPEIQKILGRFGCDNYGIMHKAKEQVVTAVECQLMTFEEVFMPHMLLADGSRLVEHATKLLPPPSP